MLRRHANLRTMADVRTHSATSATSIAPHSAYMKITSLELEKLRLARVRDNAAQRISDIDARCAEIEREKAGLLAALGDLRAQSVAPPALHHRGAPGRAHGSRSFRY